MSLALLASVVDSFYWSVFYLIFHYWFAMLASACAWPPLELRTASGIGNRAADHRRANTCATEYYWESCSTYKLFPLHSTLKHWALCGMLLVRHIAQCRKSLQYHRDKKLNGRLSDYFAIDWWLFHSDWWTTTVTRVCWRAVYPCPGILITSLQFIRFTRDSSKSLPVIVGWESPECVHSSFIGNQLFFFWMWNFFI